MELLKGERGHTQAQSHHVANEQFQKQCKLNAFQGECGTVSGRDSLTIGGKICIENVSNSSYIFPHTQDNYYLTKKNQTKHNKAAIDKDAENVDPLALLTGT